MGPSAGESRSIFVYHDCGGPMMTSCNTCAAFALSSATRLAMLTPPSRRTMCMERKSIPASFNRTASFASAPGLSSMRTSSVSCVTAWNPASSKSRSASPYRSTVRTITPSAPCVATSKCSMFTLPAASASAIAASCPGLFGARTLSCFMAPRLQHGRRVSPRSVFLSAFRAPRAALRSDT